LPRSSILKFKLLDYLRSVFPSAEGNLISDSTFYGLFPSAKLTKLGKMLKNQNAPIEAGYRQIYNWRMTCYANPSMNSPLRT